MNIFKHELDPISQNLLQTLAPTPEELSAQKEQAYIRYLKQKAWTKEWREKNRDRYNAHCRIKMLEHLQNNPQYKEKQKLRYYQKRYGVSTIEEYEQLKAQQTKAKLQELTTKLANMCDQPNKKVMTYETFVASKYN